MKLDKKISILVVFLIVIGIAIMTADSTPGDVRTASKCVRSSASGEPPTIWSSNFDVSASNGSLQDIACDASGHTHVVYQDETENLYHVEHDGASSTSPHLLGTGSGGVAICAVGTTIHIVWLTLDNKLQYTRRAGTTWEFNHTISGTGDARDIDITASSTQVIIFWRDGGTSQFMLARGSDTTWSTEVMYGGLTSDDMGAIEYKDGRLHVAFSVGDTLYYRCYQGTTIELNESVCTGLYYKPNPSIAVSSTTVYIAYTPDPITSGYYRSRPIGTQGSPWSAAIDYTVGSTYSARIEGEITCANGVLYFAWRSYKTPPITAACHFRTFNGTWSSVENASATNENCTFPRLAPKFDGVVVGFSPYPIGIPRIRYKYFPLGVRPQADIEYVKGTTGNTLSWIIMGHVHSSGNYQVFKNGELLTSAVWSNGSTISIAVDGLSTGSYNYTISAADASSNIVIDTAFVTVLGSEPDMSGLIAAIVIPCAVGGGLLVLFLLDKKKVIDLKQLFGKSKRQPSV